MSIISTLLGALAGGVVSLAIWLIKDAVEHGRRKQLAKVANAVAVASVGGGITNEELVQQTTFCLKHVNKLIEELSYQGIISPQNKKWIHWTSMRGGGRFGQRF